MALQVPTFDQLKTLLRGCGRQLAFEWRWGRCALRAIAIGCLQLCLGSSAVQCVDLKSAESVKRKS